MINSCAAIVIAAKHGELIKVKDASGIAYTVGTLRCKFEFRTSDWDYTTRTAVFCKGNMATRPSIIDTAIGVLLDKVDECAVPPEVLLPDEKYFSVGVWGVTKEGLRIVSKWLVFRIEDGCYVDSIESVPPTPSVYEQIMIEISSKSPIEHEHDDKYYSKENIDEKFKIIEKPPTKVSELENDIGYLTEYIETDPTVPAWAKSDNKPIYTAVEVGADPKGSATTALSDAKKYVDEKMAEIQIPDVDKPISTHNTSSTAHNDIRLQILDIVNRLNAFLDTDDVTLDQLSEIVAYVKNNKELIESITTFKVNVSDIVDNLTTKTSNKPLSANQGVVLKSLIDAIVVPTKVSQLDNDNKYISSIPEEYVTENELNSKGYLTEHQSLSDYAKKTEIPNISILEGKVADLEESKLDGSTLEQAIDMALAEAKESGEFDGEDGTSITHSWNGTTLTITSASGSSSVDLKGEVGANGKDGYTPQKSIDYWTEEDIAEIHTYIDGKSLIDKVVLIPIEGVCAIDKPITSSQIYTLNIGSDIAFELPTIDVDDTNYYQILVLVEVITPSAIDWGTSLFFNGDIPDIGIGKYNFIFEYDGEEWCVGVIEKGVVA